ncbi:uncharacterized protein alms1 isoform X2 [Kryptolebias marmoratus]|uniref:uncharacterized protein alms1 isoform X2 n=1 Tax=Kryptolebias marmoratus TaxID=37003 RepID=UPI0018ACAEC4|nr:uncharacterized protein alms1 isoform X2 [Kryptolebias marmoratus]
MEHQNVKTSHLSKVEDGSQPAEETLLSPSGAQSESCAHQDQRQPGVEADDWEQQSQGVALQLDFQDSNLSSALSLLGVTSEVEHSFTQYSFSQQSSPKFAPLRAYPDVSISSERFDVPLQDCVTHSFGHKSLSQYPLAQATILSEEGANSCFTQSQHSLPSESKEKEMSHLSAITDNEQGILSREGTSSRDRESDTQTDLTDKYTSGVVGDEIFFLRKDIPTQHLLDLLQKEVDLRSSGSVVSSESQTSLKAIPDKSLLKREGHPGDASLFQKQTKQFVQSRASSSVIGNITMGSRSTQPDDSSELLHRQLLSEAQKLSKLEAESNTNQQIVLTPSCRLFTSSLKNVAERKPSGRANLGSVSWMGTFSSGAEWVNKEQNLLFSQRKTGSDGSYLGFLPQSQSTPGVCIVQLKSNVNAKLGQPSAIESDKGNLSQSSTGITLQPAVSKVDAHLPDGANQCDDNAVQTSAEVQFLPSLNYKQKVDAWRAEQNNIPILKESDGISLKNKSHSSVFNPINQIFTQETGIFRRPASQNATQSSSSALSSSSLKRGEAVGSAPFDTDNRESAAPLSSFGRSQSHSSLSTVVMSVNKHQQTDTPPEKECTQSQDDAPHHNHSSTAVQPSPLISLGDVSFDQTLSSSQDSYSGVKVGASIGTSSVVSLELDNYASYWTSKQSTPPPPPKSQELNIDERIPLYLQNLGIDQTPSKILTPFAPRGPIREREFSPTDFYTIKEYTRTPSKSTQPSEGGSPHKGEFSRSSILSVDSNMSIPSSLDSLGQVVSVPSKVKARTTSLSVEAIQCEDRLASSLQPSEGFHFSSLQPSQQQWDNGQSVNQLANPSDSDTLLTLKARVIESSSNSPFQISQSMDQDANNPFVNTNALSGVRKLLSHAENIITCGSSAASSSALPAHLLSDEDIFKSLDPKTSRILDSTAADLRTPSLLLCAMSSSDSMEQTRQVSAGRESMTSSQQPDNIPFIQAVITAPATLTYNIPQGSTVGSSAETSLAISKSARRTEPEGCSAAPPENIPTQPNVMKPLPAASTQQLNSTSSDRGGTSEEEESSSTAAQSHSSSSVIEDADQEAMSDGSSESSLAVRVAKLLQSESPLTMMSSKSSITDQEENKTEEWIKLNVLGQQCELQELNIEDRKRIEEIKKELLLRHPIKSQGSTDTDSNASSSLQVNKEINAPQSVKTFSTLTDMDNHHLLGTEHPESHTQLHSTLHPDLEARLCEIAAREGVTLSAKQLQTFTSITTATRRRCTSPALPLSSAPHSLHRTELSTGTGRPFITNQPVPPNLYEAQVVALAQTTNRDQPSVYEASNSFHSRDESVTSQSSIKNEKRQNTVGGQSEDLDKTDVTIRHDSAHSFNRFEELSNHTSSVLGVGYKARQAAGLRSTARPGHVAHIHLTLSPKATDHTSTFAAHSTPPDAPTGLPQQHFISRDPASAAKSPDEGVSLSGSPGWYDSREPIRHQAPERSDTFNLFKAVAAQRQVPAASTQSFTPQRKTEAVPGTPTAETSVPVLLPYKPRGSKDVFYVPRAEADVSSNEQSDTTMESTHTGSDDAVPPHFSSDVLGSKDPGFDRGVRLKHTEGIYSKRLQAATFKMQDPEHRDASVTTDKGLPAASYQVAAAFTVAPSQSNHKISKRDQGTRPVQFVLYKPAETIHERFHQVHVETVQTLVSQTTGGQDLSQMNPEQSSGTLDHLWQKFCNQWTTDVSHPISDGGASLLKRLEYLSRYIHHTKTVIQDERDSHLEEQFGRLPSKKETHHQEVRRNKHDVFTKAEWKVREGIAEAPIQRTLQVEKARQTGENDGPASISSHSSSQTLHLSPAHTDESETLSTISGSMSTVDTARLIRAFGHHKVQHLKGSSSLRKLYSTINKQQEGKERKKDFTPSETTGTDESVAPDSASTSSTYTIPSHNGPSRALTAKRAVKLVSKSVQTDLFKPGVEISTRHRPNADNLDIVSNGTQRYTTDVGTTFPSPDEATAVGQISSPSSNIVRRRRGQKSPSKLHSIQKQRNKRSLSKPYPKGVSWFISADKLRSETRKENRPAKSCAWFEPHSRGSHWRLPLRQKQVHEDRSNQSCSIDQHGSDPAHKTRTVFSGLTRISLQESLEMHRPEFISRSRQRVRCLALQVEERRLQAVFNKERNMFNQPVRPSRLTTPAGTALLKRAVPRKEMIQRSKQIYENLPEVQQRREEEQRKVEYQSYRLNAQLYNKRITNRVLGRRAWH